MKISMTGHEKVTFKYRQLLNTGPAQKPISPPRGEQEATDLMSG